MERILRTAYLFSCWRWTHHRFLSIYRIRFFLHFWCFSYVLCTWCNKKDNIFFSSLIVLWHSDFFRKQAINGHNSIFVVSFTFFTRKKRKSRNTRLRFEVKWDIYSVIFTITKKKLIFSRYRFCNFNPGFWCLTTCLLLLFF